MVHILWKCKVLLSDIILVNSPRGRGQTHGPQRCPHPNLWNLWICYLHYKRGFADMFRLRGMGWGEYLGLSEWSQSMILSFIIEERSRRIQCDETADQWVCGWPLEATDYRNRLSPKSSMRESSLYPGFSPLTLTLHF